LNQTRSPYSASTHNTDW